MNKTDSKENKKINGILLFAKKSGPTSFSAIGSVKKALNTSKVGHTGTIDSFAQGLLVVCVGSLTKLAGNITAFNKSYKAVIKFGEETDTLEYTGNIIRTADLPTEESLRKALEKFIGNLMQKPPLYSAIHVNGKRASDIAREGKTEDIPARPITVYKAEIEELKLNSEKLVEYALINFDVSKGTYIRSLARDIAAKCNSAGHLIGLYRTKVGHFKIEDAAGFSALKPFTIEEAIKNEKAFLLQKKEKAELTLKEEALSTSNHQEKKERKPFILTPEEAALQEEIRTKLRSFDQQAAADCGFLSIHIKDPKALTDFFNGKKICTAMFEENLWNYETASQIAVFTKEENFAGLIEKDIEGRPSYKFVLN